MARINMIQWKQSRHTGLPLSLALISYAAFIINGAFVRNESLAAIAGLSGLGAMLAILPGWRRLPYYSKSMLALIFICLFLVYVKAFFYPVTYAFLLLVPSAIAIAVYIHKFPQYFRVRLVLVSLLVYFFVHVLVSGSPEGVFGGSRNQISTILISFAALALAMEEQKTDLLLVLLVFTACVLAVGSGGIISASVLVLAVLFKKSQTIYVKSLAIVLVIGAFVGFDFYVSLYAPADLAEKMSLFRLTGGDVRFQILSDYLEMYLQGIYFWLGPPDEYTFHVYSYLSYGGTWDYVDTLHNSYLSVHAKVGALALLVYFIIVRVVISLRANMYVAVLFFAILTRGFSDSVFIFDGYYNFCFYYFFILASKYRLGENAMGPQHSAPAADRSNVGFAPRPSG